MPDPTPGQVAYEAFWTALGTGWTITHAATMPEVQAAWEAAAQAVRAMQKEKSR